MGFTLSEVLITLVVIGVVAAITVPSLLQSTENQHVVQRAKKAYSTFSNALLTSRYENGPISEWYEDVDKNAVKYYERFLKPYFHSSMRCKNYTECGYSVVAPWKSPNGSTYNWHITVADSTRIFFYLNDGTFVAVQTGSSSGMAKEPNIIFDINGSQKPNIMGRDVFFMQFNEEKGAVPYGHNLATEQVNSSCSRSGNGLYCLNKLMKDSWQLKSDYPI